MSQLRPNRVKSFTIHQRNIQSLAIEMYKTKHGENPTFMKNIFVEKRDTGYSLRSRLNQDFESINIHKAHTGEDTLRFLGCKIWPLVPLTIQESNSLQEFKKQIRKWKPLNVLVEYAKYTFMKSDTLIDKYIVRIH